MGRWGYGGGGYGRGGYGSSYGGYKKKSWGGGGGGYTKKKETAPKILAGSGEKRKASAPAVEDLADGADDADVEEDGGMDSYFDDNCIEVLTFRTKCVGCRFYDGIVHPGEFVQLKREPENQYDSNAIRVDSIDGMKVGHVAAKTGDASLLAPLMDSPTTKVVIDAVAPEEKGYYEMPLVLKIFALPEDEDKVLKILGRGSSSSGSGSGSGGKKSGAARIKAETVAEKESKAKAEMEKIYGDIQKKLDAVPVVSPPSALFTKLLPHQVKGVSWMVSQETADPTALPPLWSATQENGSQVYYNEVSCSTTTVRPAPALGGILADDMGLGKTIQTLATSLCNPPASRTFAPGALADNPEMSLPEDPSAGATLIVAPASVLSNWAEQILAHILPDTVTVGLYHGPERSYDVLDCDFVITSYGVLTSEYKDHEKNKNKKRKVVKFFDKKWHRVVLDEAHQLRNPKTRMFKAAMALTSQYRWALTGTPVQNSAEDCFSLFSFLKMAPFNDAKVFKASVQRPIKNFDMLGLRRLKTAMGAILLRRIKSNMQAELQLPDKTVEIVKLDLHDEARSAYSTMHSAAKAVFEQLREHDAVLSNYSEVLEIMLRLRQVCCSHELIPPERVAAAQAVLDRLAPAAAAPTSGRSSRGKAKKAAAPKKLSLEEAQALLGQLKQQLDVVDEEIASGTTECCVCLDNIAIDDTRIIQTCSHTFCITCLDGWHRTRSAEQGSCTTCPLCRAEYSPADLVDYSTLTALTAPAVELSLEKDAPSSGSDVVTGGNGSNGSKSIKLDFLVQTLGDTPADQKTVVFSSFTSFLDLAGNQLQQEGMAHLRIDGSMSIKSRVKAMHAFNLDDGPKVLLVSLRAGGTGLNLTRANHVVLLDSWWNRSTDEQAIDRCHRIGQTRSVHVKKIVIKDSIEERILALQDHKEQIASGALGKELVGDRLNQLASLLE